MILHELKSYRKPWLRAAKRIVLLHAAAVFLWLAFWTIEFRAYKLF